MLIEEYLRSKYMTVDEFSKKVGCCRQTIWRMKNDFPISFSNSKKIELLTEGQVIHPWISRLKKDKKRGKNDNS